MKKKFFQFTKTKVLSTLIFFVILFYLVGVPVELKAVCFFPPCAPAVSFEKPTFLFGGDLSSVQWIQFIILVVLEIILSYLTSCLIVYLYKKHKRHRK